MLAATSDREAIAYTAKFLRNDVDYIGATVAETVASASYQGIAEMEKETEKSP